MFAAAQLWAADPRVGTWKLISAQSVLDPPTRVVITAQGRGEHVAISGADHVEFFAQGDGRDYPVKNVLAFNQVAIHKVNKYRAEISEKKDGVAVASVLEQISKDGRELALTIRQRGHREDVIVLRRGAAGKHAANPFIGEWTQDLSESRLRRGLVLKIEALGSDQIHFAGDFSYTAKLDGKDYPLRDSPNDTVALTSRNARTVESTYKREDKVVQRDDSVVSSDGLRMTVTTTGTLVTGQRLNETLVFAKQ